MANVAKLILWYHKYKRDLPWRKTSDPYKIWVSEIILQQTRVDQGLAYYNRFIDIFPSVNSLANATEDQVLKVWQGLGYYSRARHMLESARKIVKVYRGRFPENYSEIISLKGIGDYTAAAIASIAFNRPYPVVDGNVLRVVSRLEGIKDPIDTVSTKKIIKELLEKKIDKSSPGDFNQALMELGALVCTPSSPDCEICPLKTQCIAFSNGRINQLPVKTKRIKKKFRYFEYFAILIRKRKSWFTFIEKRSGKDIWNGLYQFPMIESEEPLKDPLEEFLKKKNEVFNLGEIIEQETSKPISHVLTHRIITARFHVIFVESAELEKYRGVMIDYKNMLSYPFPRLIDRYLDDFLKKIEKKFT